MSDCFFILIFRFTLGEILPRRTNVRLPVGCSPTPHPPERPKGTFLLALIRRGTKNEKELKQGLEAALSCFKTRCFYMSDCFFILIFRFTLGEILPRRTNVRLPVGCSPTPHPSERSKGTFLLALIRRGTKNEKTVTKGS